MALLACGSGQVSAGSQVASAKSSYAQGRSLRLPTHLTLFYYKAWTSGVRVCNLFSAKSHLQHLLKPTHDPTAVGVGELGPPEGGVSPAPFPPNPEYTQ